jgi:hypothetical protein
MRKRCECGGAMQVKVNPETEELEWLCARCGEWEPLGLDVEQQLADAPRLFE